MAGKYMSLSSHWFGSMKSTYMSEKISSVDGDDKCFVSCDSLVSFHVKRGTQKCIEFYCILGIFSKHYCKWFIR
jgi:hypothetical protein